MGIACASAASRRCTSERRGDRQGIWGRDGVGGRWAGLSSGGCLDEADDDRSFLSALDCAVCQDRAYDGDCSVLLWDRGEVPDQVVWFAGVSDSGEELKSGIGKDWGVGVFRYFGIGVGERQALMGNFCCLVTKPVGSRLLVKWPCLSVRNTVTPQYRETASDANTA